MTFEEFEDTIELALEQIPREFKDVLKDKQIGIVAREKTPEEMRRRHPAQFIFGAFIGQPYGHFVLANLVADPTRIELYKDSFDFLLKTDDEIKAQIQKTLVHEIAHYLGFTEKQIRDLGY